MAESKMTKTERDELRRVVRQDFKVLGQEMDVRRAELLAEIEQRVAHRFQPSEDAIAEAETQLANAWTAFSKDVRRIVEDLREHADGYDVRVLGGDLPRLVCTPTSREEMRRALIADLDARIAAAKVRIRRQENDLLKQLASGAIESAEARKFLESIPTVAELVPSERLAELESAFHAPDYERPGLEDGNE